MAFQSASEKLIEKKTGKELSLRTVKEVKAAIGYDFFPQAGLKFITEIGYCQYWDEAIPLHARSNGYTANGLFGTIDFGYLYPDFISVGTKFTCSYNDSIELKRLIETTGKTVVQLDLYLSLKLSDW
jgi:hypothetical protein